MSNDIWKDPQDPTSADGDRSEIDRKILRGSSWVAVAYGSRAALTLLSTLVLVRLLEPSAFGLVALASTFVLVLDYLQATGMTAALITRRDDIERAAASALVFSSLAACALFGASYAIAPLFARLVDNPDVTDVVRVLAVLLIVRGVGVVPGALLERELDFRTRAKGEVGAIVLQVVLAIALAWAGFGVWSLVIGQLAGATLQTAAFWVFAPWRPSPRLASWRVLRELVAYARFVSAGNLLGLFNTALQNIVVGRLLGATALGYYTVTFRLADLPTSVVGYVVGRVMLPAYSLLQEDLEGFRRAFTQNLQRVALFSLPLATILGVAAEPIVLALLGDEWRAVVTPLRIVAAYSVVRSFASCAGPMFQAAGKPHLVPLWALPHTILILPALLILTPRYGVSGAATAMLVAFSASGIPAFVAAVRMLGLSGRELARSLAPLVLSSAVLGLGLFALVEASGGVAPLVSLALVGFVGVGVYAGAVATFARGLVTPMLATFRSSA